jgi:heterotetrameric sarcosine oxidase gamma subunit
MSDMHAALVPNSPFATLPLTPAQSSGLFITGRHGLGLATVLVRKGRSASLAERVRENFHIELPDRPYRAMAGEITFVGVGPGAWLATHEQGDKALAAALGPTIGDLVSISDQSDGYAVLRLSGPKVRETLCKLVPLDVHPRAFEVGAVAATAAAHMPVILWRLQDSDNGAPVFELAIYRSFSEGLGRFLSESAAECQ